MLCVTFLFQISSHVKAIDAIYQGTDFMGIRNISFMVKRIRVSLLLIQVYTLYVITAFASELVVILPLR